MQNFNFSVFEDFCLSLSWKYRFLQNVNHDKVQSKTNKYCKFHVDLTRRRLSNSRFKKLGMVPKKLYRNTLRAVVSNFRESGDRAENSNFFLFAQKNPFGELFSKIIFKGSSHFLFWQKNGKFEIGVVYHVAVKYHLVLSDLFPNFKPPTIINKLLWSLVHYVGSYKIRK